MYNNIDNAKHGEKMFSVNGGGSMGNGMAIRKKET